MSERRSMDERVPPDQRLPWQHDRTIHKPAPLALGNAKLTEPEFDPTTDNIGRPLVQVPYRLESGAGISVDYDLSSGSISIDLANVQPVDKTTSDDRWVPIWDAKSGETRKAHMLGSGLVPPHQHEIFDVIDLQHQLDLRIGEAPNDGTAYVRQSRSWQPQNLSVNVDWAVITGKPSVFPPELPIPSSGVTGLDAKQVAQDDRLTSLESADVVHDNRLASVEGVNTAQDSRLTAVETKNTTQDGRLTAVEDKNTTQDAAITANATALAGKEPAIATGNPAYFFAGDKTWKPVPAAGLPEAPTDGQAYTRKSSAWVADPIQANPPNDGNQYARKGDATWVKVTGGVYLSDTPPAGAPDSALWVESDSGALFVRWNDGSSTQWVMLNAAGMPEAPIDTKQYARRDGGWSEVVSPISTDAPADSKSYARRNNAWAVTVPEAPADGGAYVRYNSTWYNINVTFGNYLPLAGGTVTGALTVNSTLTAGGVLLANNSFQLKNGTHQTVYGGGIYLYDSGGSANYCYLTTNSGVYSYPIFGTNQHSFNGRATGTGAGAIGYDSGTSIYGCLSYQGYGLYTPYQCYIGQVTMITGILYSTGSMNSTTASAANVWQNSTSGNYARVTSSMKYKTAIEPLWDSIGDLIMTLKPIFYRSNELTIDRQDWSWYSFAAEDVAAADPRFANWAREVKRDAEGKPIPIMVKYKTKQADGSEIDEERIEGYEAEEEETPNALNLNAIVSALVNLVQRQDARITALEAALAV